jgi:hypothetical protein
MGVVVIHRRREAALADVLALLQRVPSEGEQPPTFAAFASAWRASSMGAVHMACTDVKHRQRVRDKPQWETQAEMREGEGEKEERNGYGRINLHSVDIEPP